MGTGGIIGSLFVIVAIFVFVREWQIWHARIQAEQRQARAQNNPGRRAAR